MGTALGHFVLGLRGRLHCRLHAQRIGGTRAFLTLVPSTGVESAMDRRKTLRDDRHLCCLVATVGMDGRQANLELEILFVDDGSTDGSWDMIRDLAGKDERVHGIRFRRNFGKAAALAAGFRHVQGALVFTLDGDLQDDPQAIPLFLVAMEKGLDVVSGWKRVRHDPWHKVFPSRVFNFLVSWLTGVWLHDHNCGMKCYRAEIFREVRLYGELHRFIPVLAAARGYTVGEIEINHRPRRFGHSKY